ncbi:MAG TPA: ABC transporter substrate-binding protein, partial [Chthoniobacterales bacterium]|nr:ABC transporter substrate-binding protein [Chthoniobacterales bacterium]
MDADKYSAVPSLPNKVRQQVVMDRWVSGLISKIGRRIYQCRHPIVVGAINLSFVICHLSFAGATEDPVGQLHGQIDKVLAIAYSGQNNQALPDRVRPLLEKDFSFELVTRQAMGPGWRQFTPADQQKVTDLFSRLVIRIYAARVVGTQRPNIAYGKMVTLAPDRCEIPTRVTAPNGDRPYAVVYRLINLSGTWRIYDVLIEGVSFVANYRAQFDELVQRGGAPAVIKTLEAKLAEPINPNP